RAVELDLRPSLVPHHLYVAKAPRLQPQCLRDRLLGAEPGRQVLARPPLAGRVGALALGEQPLCQPRPSFERPLQPLDLEQVDSDPPTAHSTVTVFARLR